MLTSGMIWIIKNWVKKRLYISIIVRLTTNILSVRQVRQASPRSLCLLIESMVLNPLT